MYFYFFFFNDTATTEIYTLSLHDALPIWAAQDLVDAVDERGLASVVFFTNRFSPARSEEHTSELQSHLNLVCRLLLEKKKHTILPTPITRGCTMSQCHICHRPSSTSPSAA